MMVKKYSEEEKESILLFAQTHSIAETRRKYGIRYGTLRCWRDPKFKQKQLEYLKQDYIKNGQKPHRKNYHKQRNKKIYQENKESIKISNHEYYLNNKDKVKYSNQKWTKENPQKNAARVKKYQKHRNATDPNYFLRGKLRGILSRIIREQNIKKEDLHALELLGCSVEDFRKHIEDQFKEGMTWANHGEWHLDHIKPLSSFDLTQKENMKVALHYTNHQPLWARDNLLKGDKLITH